MEQDVEGAARGPPLRPTMTSVGLAEWLWRGARFFCALQHVEGTFRVLRVARRVVETREIDRGRAAGRMLSRRAM